MTDTDALKERIARVLYAQIWLEPHEHPFNPHDDEGRGALLDAAAVLPIVAEEVRKAKAEAWDEGYDAGYDHAPMDRYSESDPEPLPNPYRETGDKHE